MENLRPFIVASKFQEEHVPDFLKEKIVNHYVTIQKYEELE